MIDDNELNDLIENAARLGYDNKELLLNRLKRIISADADYLNYRQKRGRTGRYNEAVAEDMLALAMAVKMLSEM